MKPSFETVASIMRVPNRFTRVALGAFEALNFTDAHGPRPLDMYDETSQLACKIAQSANARRQLQLGNIHP